MKIALPNRAAFLVLLFTLASHLDSAFAQNTGFTYQGRLNNGAGVANGIYDFTFTIFDATTSTNAFAVQTNLDMTVSNGLFTVTLDWGAAGVAIFSGGERWLEIAVRTNATGVFTTLSPRQKITPAPYAFFAQSVGALANGTYGSLVSFTNTGDTFSGTFTGNGSALTNVNAATLDGYGYCALPCYWNVNGNTGTLAGINFIGTADYQALTLKVNSTPAVQFTPGATLPNVVGGLGGFRPTRLSTGVSGVVVAGGNAPSGSFSGVGAGDYMAAFDDDDTIGGGFGNKAGTDNGDTTDAAFATISGGIFNVAANFAATVGGGAANTANGAQSVVAGGNGNLSGATYSSIGGGFGNSVQPGAVNAAICGGLANLIESNAVNSLIGGGSSNLIFPGVTNATIGGGSQNTIQMGAFGTAGGTIAGGISNTIAATASDPRFTTISGGYSNVVADVGCTVGGGFQNSSTVSESTVAGGYQNTASANDATVGGGFQNTSSGGSATVGGGAFNFATGLNTTVAGGSGGESSAQGATVGGGENNVSSGTDATAPGGFYNWALGICSFAAGQRARANHDGSFVWADYTPYTDFTSVASNTFNVRAQGGVYFVTSGAGVMVDGQAVALATKANTFSGTQTFNGGILLNSTNGFDQSSAGTFFIDAPFIPGGRLAVLSNGNVGIGTNNPTHKLVVGNAASPAYCDGTTWQNGSDRNSKQAFRPIDPLAVLEKISAMPITEWQYSAEADGVRHLGPMAQDFYAAFGLNGTDDKHISTVDEGGVALAAIQGLNQKIEDKDSEIQNLRQQNQSLELRLRELEQAVRSLRRP